MVSIIMDGQDKTKQISDWKIWKAGEELWLTCNFPSGKSFKKPINQCDITPTEVINDKLLKRKDGYCYDPVEEVVIYGNKYAVVQYQGQAKRYVMQYANIQLVDKTDVNTKDVFQYFTDIAKRRVFEPGSGSKSPIAENILRQLEALPSLPGTALDAYCTGRSQQIHDNESFIFPFGINESQLKALRSVFSSQISIIEGPPGTGKTQTILNILANILLRGQTVAILSNNNTAVENIYEKLAKDDLDFLVAKLGNEQNRKAFFANVPEIPNIENDTQVDLSKVKAQIEKLEKFLHAQNEIASLKAKISELEIEHQYLLKWQEGICQDDHDPFEKTPLKKYGLSKSKSVDLMAYLTFLEEGSISLRNRFELFMNFRILRTGPFRGLDKLNAMTYALQLKFYEDETQEKQKELAELEKLLKHGNFEALLKDVTASSMSYFKQTLLQREWPKETFSAQSYRSRINTFLKRFPIIGSGTHSIVNTLKAGTVLDYVIIDEASQQDIVPGILALGCAKNLVIVGDRKQLPPIFSMINIPAPGEMYDCKKYSLLESCSKVFDGTAPITLLKEHYRCHPRIIQFCNQQFYDNQLIPMTKHSDEAPLQLIITAKGNHTRGNKNLRELDSLIEIQNQGESSHWDETSKRGFIAPYNAQIELSKSQLSASFIKDTTHKFQGRECDEIVFSTVLDKKRSNERKLNFVDDPNLINVAVSRAKKQFTLITGEEVFTASNGPIAALIRYIEYYNSNGESSVHRGPVISAFDLLYSEYDQSLESLRSKLRPGDSKFKSEQIVAARLREILLSSGHDGIMFHREIALHKLVSTNHEALSKTERKFMNRSRCDFVLYHKVGKKPFAVIEVDGGMHDRPEQQRRDALKNSILYKGGLPLLRLRTVESRIEERIEQFINSSIESASSDSRTIGIRRK